MSTRPRDVCVGALIAALAVSGCATAATPTLAPETSPVVQASIPAPEEALEICVTFDKMGAYREGNKYYLDQAAAELGVNIDFYVADEDAQKQSAQVDTCIAKGVDGIIVNPWDIQAVLQDIDRAHEAGIIIGTMGQYPARDDTTDFLYTANCYADGSMLGEWLVENSGDNPIKLVNLQGSLSHDCGVLRDKGLKEAIAGHDNIEIVMDCPTEWRPEPALACMENALQAFPDMNAVYAATDGLLPPVFSALETAGRLVPVGDPGHVIVMSIDGDPQGCAAVRDGFMDAGIAAGENPNSGRQAIEAIIKIKATGERLPDAERIIQNEGYLYTPANLDEVQDLVWGCVIGSQ